MRDYEIFLKRDLVRVPRRFIDYLASQSKAVPVIVGESTNNKSFGNYWIRREDPNIPAIVAEAEWWIAPDGPFRQGNIVKSARYLLRAIQADAAASMRANLKAVPR